jgi:prepilin-type processing-associated H-X9-DG protein
MNRPVAKHDPPPEDALNEAQRLRLNVSCQYIDRLLTDVGSILHAATSPSPFARYKVDISPAQVRVIEDYIHRLRQQLLRSLAWQHLDPGDPAIPATHAILKNLSFIDIAVEELRPRHMRGSGPVSDLVAGELNGVVHELRSLIEGMNRYLRQERGTNLEARLEHLLQQGADVPLLQTTSEIIARHGLVEFRGRLEALTSRLEDANFEVAFFGRVSSGKSSLLNALLSKDVLPVGTNPITAVPTKLRSGPNGRAIITFADGHSEKIPLDEIAQFVTEQGNPGNARNVIKAVAEIPSPSLPPGIVLVDTPGLGSLAIRGAAETLAYLPSADLGILLVDAGASLSEEDIGTLRLLYQAGIPSLILLSKADLLDEDDLESALAYIREHLEQQLGIQPTVYPVSARPSHSLLLDHFYQAGLLPRFRRCTRLRDESATRKIAALRDAVIANIEAALDRNRLLGNLNRNRLEELEATLRHTIGVIGEQPRVFEHDLLQLEEGCDRALSHVAEAGLQWVKNTRQTEIPAGQICTCVTAFVEDQLREPLRRLRQTSEQAIHDLQQVAATLNTPDTPAVNEIDLLLRDLPRFAFAALRNPVPVGRGILFGGKIGEARMRSHLREQLEPLLRDQLRAYGRVLHRWMQRATRDLERLASSYADGYRVQMQRLAGHTPESIDLDSLRLDLALLMRAGTKVEGQIPHKQHK